MRRIRWRTLMVGAVVGRGVRPAEPVLVWSGYAPPARQASDRGPPAAVPFDSLE
jgi:hypothetical protein